MLKEANTVEILQIMRQMYLPNTMAELMDPLSMAEATTAMSGAKPQQRTEESIDHLNLNKDKDNNQCKREVNSSNRSNSGNQHGQNVCRIFQSKVPTEAQSISQKVALLLIRLTTKETAITMNNQFHSKKPKIMILTLSYSMRTIQRQKTKSSSSNSPRFMNSMTLGNQ